MSMKDFVNTLNDEQKQALLKALKDEDNVALAHIPTETKEQTKAIINENFTMTKPVSGGYKKRKEPVKAQTNTWTDTGESKEILTPKINPTPRTRKPPVKVKLRCHVCNKDFDIDKRFVFGEYNRCDRCASKK